MRVMRIINDLPSMRPAHGQVNKLTFNGFFALTVRGIAGIGDSVHSSSPSTPSPLSNASSVNSRSLFFRMALSGKCNV